MTHPNPDPAPVAAVIAAMEHYQRAWQTVLAEFQTADGDIHDDRQSDYEQAKDDHAWPVLDTLPEWISLLKAALGDQTAPETAPETAP